VIKKMSLEEMVEAIQKNAAKNRSEYATIIAPIVRGRKGEYFQLLQNLFEDGFSEARVDGEIKSLHERVEMKRYGAHSIEVVVDKVLVNDQTRIFEAVETALEYGKGLVIASFANKEEMLFSSHWTCPHDSFAFPEIEPRLFSFNSPFGACEACHA
jgi:excinuclease ABC subunit A